MRSSLVRHVPLLKLLLSQISELANAHAHPIWRYIRVMCVHLGHVCLENPLPSQTLLARQSFLTAIPLRPFPVTRQPRQKPITVSRRRIDAVPIVPTRVRSRRRRRFRVVRLQHPLGRPEFDRILPLHPRRFVQRLRPDASRDYEFVLDRRRRAHVRVDQRRRGLALDVVSKAQQRGVGVDVVGARDGARDGVDRDRDDRDCFDGARGEARAATAAHRARACADDQNQKMTFAGVEFFETKARRATISVVFLQF